MRPTIAPCHLESLDCFVVKPPMGWRIEGCHFIYDAQEVHIVFKEQKE
jgi:hypothetical protein